MSVTPEAYLQYDWQGWSIEYHRADIRKLLAFRESTVADAEQMKQWLIAEVLPQEHQDERLREEAYAWFRPMHLEAPTPDRLTRLIRSALHTLLRRIRELTLPDTLFSGIARKVLLIFRNRASIEEPSRLRAHAPAKRLTLLAILCFMRSQEITDGLVDLLIHIVHKIDVRAEKWVEQEYANEFKRVAIPLLE